MEYTINITVKLNLDSEAQLQDWVEGELSHICEVVSSTIVSAAPEHADHCEQCKTPFDAESIGGGRCTKCGTMIAAELPVTVTEHTIDLTPRGYTVPGGAQRVADAMKAWEDSTEVLANVAQQYVEMGDTFSSPELYASMEAAITTRKEKVEALVRAVAGR